ncbi:MAG: hypothetical protein ACKVU1_07860 [bacterium]
MSTRAGFFYLLAGFIAASLPTSADASIARPLSNSLAHSTSAIDELPRLPISDSSLSCDVAFRLALDDIRVENHELPALGTLESRDGRDAKPKSPAKAMLLSALVPGLGQMYSGHEKTGLAYLGIEAAGWTGFSILRTDGFATRRNARKIADAYYDSTAYNAKKEESIEPPNRDLPYRDDGSLDDLEYYEDISKLNELIWGWEDHVPAIDQVTGRALPGTSARREAYKNQRTDGNNDLRTSRNIGLALFVNHMISAAHAFKLVQWYNKSVNPSFSGLKLKIRQTRDKEGLCCVVSKRF